jgi:hypothetical protein
MIQFIINVTVKKFCFEKTITINVYNVNIMLQCRNSVLSVTLAKMYVFFAVYQKVNGKSGLDS